MKFYVRRFAFYLATLWFAVTLNFVLPRLLPGDPATILLQKLARQGGEVTPAMIRSVELLLGTSDGASLWSQYWSYLGSILRGDLGVSISNYPEQVTTLIGQALPWTLALVGLATLISFLIGIFVGAYVGWDVGRPHHPGDHLHAVRAVLLARAAAHLHLLGHPRLVPDHRRLGHLDLRQP
jgi:peptide/nickel transport system permease protein